MRKRLTRDRRMRLQAIADAAAPGLFVASTRTDGLRAILLFERLNGIALDPRDRMHMVKITNSGWWFALERRLRRLRSGTSPTPA